MLDENKEGDNKTDIQTEPDQSNNEKEIKSISEENLNKVEDDIQSEKLGDDRSIKNVESENQKKPKKRKKWDVNKKKMTPADLPKMPVKRETVKPKTNNFVNYNRDQNE